MRKSDLPNESPHIDRYLRPDEANALIDAAGRVGRQRLRDQALLRLIYRHGLRASEAKHVKWTDFDLSVSSGPKTFHVRRLKGSNDSTHTLDRDEVLGTAQAEGCQHIAASLRLRAWWAAITRHDCAHRGACSGGRQARVPRSPAYAAPRYRLRPGQRGDGHKADTGLPWSRLDLEHGALYEVGAGSIGGCAGEMKALAELADDEGASERPGQAEQSGATI